MNEVLDTENCGERRSAQPLSSLPAEAHIQVCGARYRLNVEKREFQNVDDSSDRISFDFGDPLVWDGEKWRFSGDENGWLVIAAFRLMMNPDLTLKEAFHSCKLIGHLFVSDQAKDIDWNRHYVLFPQQCKVCGQRTVRTEIVSQEKRLVARTYVFIGKPEHCPKPTSRYIGQRLSVVAIDEPIERWIKAIKVPVMTYADVTGEIPKPYLEALEAERLARAASADSKPIATDMELFYYFLTKSQTSDFTQEDDQLYAHIFCRLREKYPSLFAHLEPNNQDYEHLDSELSRQLEITAAYLEVQKDFYYEKHLQAYVEASFEQYGCYIDPHFIADPDSTNGGDPNDR